MKTFTLVELILVVAIVAILASAMIPAITSARQKARAAKVVQLAETLTTACKLFNSDTGFYATGHSGFPVWQSLVVDNGMPGWNGPYINKPLTADDTPFGDTILISPNMVLSFDLDGDGAVDKKAWSPGNSISIWRVVESDAEAINDAMDNNLGGNWKITGRVKYTDASETVAIYLTGGS